MESRICDVFELAQFFGEQHVRAIFDNQEANERLSLCAGQLWVSSFENSHDLQYFIVNMEIESVRNISRPEPSDNGLKNTDCAQSKKNYMKTITRVNIFENFTVAQVSSWVLSLGGPMAW